MVLASKRVFPQPAKEQFKHEVEKELTGRDTEPAEIIYFKLYKSQIPVIEQAIETAALMLGTDKSRGYCLEMICADFLAGANLDNENPEVLLQSALRFFKFLPGQERETFLTALPRRHPTSVRPKRARLRLDPGQYGTLRNQVLRRDGWKCQSCGTMSNLEVHHREFRSQAGGDSEENLLRSATHAMPACMTVGAFVFATRSNLGAPPETPEYPFASTLRQRDAKWQSAAFSEPWF